MDDSELGKLTWPDVVVVFISQIRQTLAEAPAGVATLGHRDGLSQASVLLTNHWFPAISQLGARQ